LSHGGLVDNDIEHFGMHIGRKPIASRQQTAAIDSESKHIGSSRNRTTKENQMSKNINFRAATDIHPSTVPSTSSISPTTISPRAPKRPLPRWVAPVGVVAAMCVGGAGVVIYSANNDSAAAPTQIEALTNASPAVRVGQIAQPGLPDGGVAQPVPAQAAQNANFGTGEFAQRGLPDGYFQKDDSSPTAPRVQFAQLAPPGTPDSDVGTGQIAQSGMPDGYFQSTTATSSAPAVRDGQIAQPGNPDGGITQPTTAEATTPGFGCKVTGPC
jgi:hypothetical protein